ncbi:MAG: sulfite exporter TauE/SafE family protein [Planctomycetota bacterium]|jgi:uncharacterized membrane protein YfcA
MELSLLLVIAIIVVAFLCEYVDSSLGMGYGTTLAPVLLLMGFAPMEIVPAILLSELITGVLAGIFHHREGNVNFKPSSREVFKITNMLKPLGYIESVRRTVPRHLKVALFLAGLSILGTVAAVFIAVNIPKFWLKLYIGGVVLAMGIIILACLRREFKFSWTRLSLLGLVASFNKGLSGGGYGPVVTGGQILSGVESKSAVGITSLAEGLTCLVGVVLYFVISKEAVTWQLAPWLIAGAVASVPLTAKSVKLISASKLKVAIAVVTIILGLFTIIKTLR